MARNTDNKPDEAQTADGAAGNESQQPTADVTAPDYVATDGATIEQARADAQASIQSDQEAIKAARADDTIDPSATFVRGVEGNVNLAAPANAPVISTYEDALEAGYFGVAPGYANTEKMSVAAVTERDRKLGLPGTKGTKGAVVNGSGDDAATKDASR